MNNFLKERDLFCEDLQKDLRSGVLLIALLEIISGKSLGKYIRNPKMVVQWVENLNIALQFMKHEGLRLVNIGPEGIYLVGSILYSRYLWWELKVDPRSDLDTNFEILYCR